MNLPRRSYGPASILPALLLWVVSFHPLLAQSETGALEGRVVNPATGEYLERARVVIEGTALETFTDADGAYRFTGVPTGTARVRTFFTGFAEKSDQVAIVAGQTARLEVALAPASVRGAAAREGEIVQLAEVVVGASREMTAAAIAINEQRFAPNEKTVVSTEEFGTVAEGNVAEFLKFVPGVTINYVGGTARGISVEGAPTENVPVTLNGFDVATASSATSRDTVADMVSINNLSRIEVAYSPTPESPGTALTGTVNMVPRSAFERRRPLFSYSVYAMMRDNFLDLKRTPGPRHEYTYKWNPGFDLSYVAPVNERFGFTVSAGHSTQYSDESDTITTWRGAGAATNGGTLPTTTPGHPYLSDYSMRDGVKTTTRNSIGLTLDYKLGPADRISFTSQAGNYYAPFNNRQINFVVGRVAPDAFTLNSTHGSPGAGTLTESNSSRNRYNRNYMFSTVWRHDGPTWHLETGAGNSFAENKTLDMDQGTPQTSNVTRSGVTISFDDINLKRPGRFTVLDGTTGAAIDPFRLDTYALTSIGSNQTRSIEQLRNAYANVKRDFADTLPLTLKAGANFRQARRDSRNTSATYNEVGRDGRASTAPAAGDEPAAPFLDTIASLHPEPYGLPLIQWTNNGLLWDYFQANPSFFTHNDSTIYRAAINGSKLTQEFLSAAYLRGDLSALSGRLKLIGGLRAEQTNVKAEGPLVDPTRNVQRDASGAPIRGANGQPLPITTITFEADKLTRIERGTHVEREYLRLFPSLNASYQILSDLIARGSFYTSVGRPNLNQYAGGITLPDTDSPPSTTNRIVVNNAGIKAWQAKTVRLRLEYYFQGVGQVSLGAFRRELKDFFGATLFHATPEFLALYGADPALYGAYDVSTQYNVPGTVRVDGLQFSYKQALTFLPQWARGLQVFCNGSAQHMTGASTGAYTNNNTIPRTGSWGISLTRPKYNGSINWNYRGRNRGAQVTGGSIEPGTFNYDAARLYIDVNAEYNFAKHASLFANLRNVRDEPEVSEITGPSTPAIARPTDRVSYGALWTIGVKGRF